MSPRSEAPIIQGAGALCAVGRGVKQVYASVRAGIGRVSASSALDRRHEPINMALFPADVLEPLAEPLAATALTDRGRRMVRLAGSPLREAVADLPEGSGPLPLFLGLPEPHPGEAPNSALVVLGALGKQAGVALDETRSQVFARGRAAALLALEAGSRFLGERRAESVLVGGVDSYLDLAVLSELDLEGRIHGPTVAHGFVPGEGAAFLLLSAARGGPRQAPCVTVLGVGTARDPGHRYSDQPALGEGLSQAIEKMVAGLPRPPGPIVNTFAGFNGELFGAKEWGVANLRHSQLRGVGWSIPSDSQRSGRALS